MVSGDFIINDWPVTRAPMRVAILSDVLFSFLYTSFVFVFLLLELLVFTTSIG